MGLFEIAICVIVGFAAAGLAKGFVTGVMYGYEMSLKGVARAKHNVLEGQTGWEIMGGLLFLAVNPFTVWAALVLLMIFGSKL